MKYEFHVGDYVETKDGQIGYISIFIHNFDGGNTIFVNYRDGRTQGYKFYKDELLHYFNRIGQYDFAKSEQSKEIEQLPDDLLPRFELPDGKSMILKTYTDSKDFVEASYSRDLINKINELVDAVNELRGGQEKC